VGILSFILRFIAGIVFTIAFVGLTMLVLNAILPSTLAELKENMKSSIKEEVSKETGFNWEQVGDDAALTAFDKNFDEGINKLIEPTQKMTMEILYATIVLFLIGACIIYLAERNIWKTIISVLNSIRNSSFLYAIGFVVMMLVIPSFIEKELSKAPSEKFVEMITQSVVNWVQSLFFILIIIFGSLGLVSWITAFGLKKLHPQLEQ